MKLFLSVFFILALIHPTLGCSSRESIRSRAFYETTFIYLGTDVSSIDFNKLEKSRYNDLIYKNTLVKFIMINTYTNNKKYTVQNLSGRNKNILCLASIFVDNYQPLEYKEFNNKLFSESVKDLAKLRVELINSIDYALMPPSEMKCKLVYEDIKEV